MATNGRIDDIRRMSSKVAHRLLHRAIIFAIPMTVEVTPEKQEQKRSPPQPASVFKHVGSIRVKYYLVVALTGWFTFALVIWFLRLAGFLSGR